MRRRDFLQGFLAASSALLVLPMRAIAAVWNRKAFEADNPAGALEGLGASPTQPTQDIVLNAPDRAENGAVVQIEVQSRIPGTEAIAIVVEHNPTALIANFLFAEGADPYVVTRIKMAETSTVQAIVKVGDQYYQAGKQVEVMLNGCE